MKKTLHPFYFLSFLPFILLFLFSDRALGNVLELYRDGVFPSGPPLGTIAPDCLKNLDCAIPAFALTNRNCLDPAVVARGMCLGIQKGLLGADCRQFSPEVALYCLGVRAAISGDSCGHENDFCPVLRGILQGNACENFTRAPVRDLCRGVRESGLKGKDDFLSRREILLEKVQEKKKQCFEFDHQALFGPIRNQYDHGLCWGFSATGLLEEHLCLKNPQDPFCGKFLSVLDASRELWRFGQEKEGGFTELAILTSILRGVCLEEDAPFPSTADELKAMEVVQTVFGYLKYGEIQVVVCSGEPAEQAQRRDGRLAEIFYLEGEWKKIFSQYLQQEQVKSLPGSYADLLKEIFKFSPQAPDALREALLTKNCKDKRILGPFKNLKISYSEFEPGKTPLEEVISTVRDSMSKGRSLALSLCLTQYKKEPEGGCGRHSLIINGQRWNPAGFCEWHVRNSHGKEDRVGGWTQAEALAKESLKVIMVNEDGK